MDELGVLRWFVEAANCGSFTTTAQKFGVSPAAVSMGMSRLEKRLGTRLFNRTTRQLHLTSEGRVYLDKAAQGLALLAGAAVQVQGMRDEPNGLIRLCTVTSFGRHYLLSLLAEFLEKYPKVNLETCFQDEVPDLVKDGFDLAIRRGVTEQTNYVTRRLCKRPIILVASPAYLARKGVPETPDDLIGHDWISSRISPRQVHSLEFKPVKAKVRKPGKKPSEISKGFTLILDPLDATFSRRSENKTVIIRQHPTRFTITKQPDAVCEAAVSGMGISILSTNLALPHLRSGALKLLLPNYVVDGHFDIFIQYPHREYLPPKVRVLIDFLVERCAADPELSYDPVTLRRYAAIS